MDTKRKKTGFPDGSDGKESACNAGDPGSIPGLGREQQPAPVFLPGEFHGQRSQEQEKWSQEEQSLHNAQHKSKLMLEQSC